MENWYEVMYNTRLDKLVLRKPKLRKLRGKIIRKIRRHKLISLIIFVTMIFSIINITMIINFFEILQKI